MPDPFGDVEHAAKVKGPGGIPAWGIGIGLAALVVGYRWWENRSANAGATAAGGTAGATDMSGTPIGTVSYDYTSPTYEGPPIYGGAEGYPYSAAPPAPATNTQWERAVEDWLISKGEQPGDVGDTLSDYLDGQGLNGDERGMIDLAEDFWGAPPQGVPITPAHADRIRERRRNQDSDDDDGDGDTDDDGTGDGGSSGGGNPGRYRPPSRHKTNNPVKRGAPHGGGSGSKPPARKASSHPAASKHKTRRR